MLLRPRLAPSRHGSNWLVAFAARRPHRRPPQAWPQLLGRDLDHGSGAAILSGPGALLEPTDYHDPAAPAQGFGRMLGLVAPDDDGEERRLLLPPARDGHPEHGPGDAAVGMPQLGVVGEVAGEAHGCLGHDSALLDCLAGRSALPLEPGDGGHRGMPGDRRRQAMEPTKSAMYQDCRPMAGSGAELVGGAL